MVPEDTNQSAKHAAMCLRLRVADASAAERAAAEAYDAGAVGLEERALRTGVELLIYSPAARASHVTASLEAVFPGAALGPPEEVSAAAWSDAWKAHAEPVEVSRRLVVRPSSAPVDARPGRRELIVDPRQAFGTGSHASTRLALEWIDVLAPRLPAGARVLDVGCGSGVLALAALTLGAGSAVGFDLDAEAARESVANAARNGCAAGLLVFCGPIGSLAGEPFELVVANLLRSELLPLVGAVAERVRPGGHAVVSGLLEADAEPVRDALDRVGLAVAGERRRDDGGERWIALHAIRQAPASAARQ